MFLIELEAIRYLARQGLSFRGHKDTSGNLHQLLLSESIAFGNSSLK